MNSTRNFKTCRLRGGVILSIVYVLFFSTSIISLNCLSGSKVINKTILHAPFDIQEFSMKAFTAWWLYKYDMVAWWTSDSVLTENDSIKNQLSKIWFCFEDNGNFHAVYGHYDSLQNNYDIAINYKVDSTGKVIKVFKSADSTIINPLARALIISAKAADSILSPILEETGVRFNQYVRKEKDGNIRTWFLPSMLEKEALYGIDLSYLISANGDSVISSEIHNEGLRYFKINPKKEIQLSNEINEMPTIGNLFFVIQFRNHFKYIRIRNKASISEMVFSKPTKEWVWLHAMP